MTTRRDPGVTVFDVPAGTSTRRCRARGADLVLLVLTGTVTAAVDGRPDAAVSAGSAVTCPAGTPWRVRAAADARVLAVGLPAGPETVLRALAGPAGGDPALLVLAAEAGVELLLDPL